MHGAGAEQIVVEGPVAMVRYAGHAAVHKRGVVLKVHGEQGARMVTIIIKKAVRNLVDQALRFAESQITLLSKNTQPKGWVFFIQNVYFYVTDSSQIFSYTILQIAI